MQQQNDNDKCLSNTDSTKRRCMCARVPSSATVGVLFSCNNEEVRAVSTYRGGGGGQGFGKHPHQGDISQSEVDYVGPPDTCVQLFTKLQAPSLVVF